MVRKSSICWLLSLQISKLSSDRLYRVRASEYGKKGRDLGSPKVTSVTEAKEIFLGDGCIFQRIDSEDFIAGLVLSFFYTTGETWKVKEYSNFYANISGNKKSIGVLCQWFDLDNSGYLTLVQVTVHGYYAIEQYRFTIPAPEYTQNDLQLDHEVFSQLKQKLTNKNPGE